MWLKKCTCFLLACVAVFGCLFTPVAAAELGEQKVASSADELANG